MILSYYFQVMIANINVRQFSTAIVRFAKKQKSDATYVRLKSVVSGYTIPARRHRLGDKMETLAFDPIVQQEVLFREDKKVKTFEGTERLEWWHQPDEVKYPEHFQVDDSHVDKRIAMAQKSREAAARSELEKKAK